MGQSVMLGWSSPGALLASPESEQDQGPGGNWGMHHSSAICWLYCSLQSLHASSYTFLFNSECALVLFCCSLKGKLNCNQKNYRSGWKNTPSPGVMEVVVNFWFWFCHFLSVLLVNSPPGIAGCAPCCFHHGSLRNCSWNAGMFVPKKQMDDSFKSLLHLSS